jgi:hypothetical protein
MRSDSPSAVSTSHRSRSLTVRKTPTTTCGRQAPPRQVGQRGPPPGGVVTTAASSPCATSSSRSATTRAANSPASGGVEVRHRHRRLLPQRGQPGCVLMGRPPRADQLDPHDALHPPSTIRFSPLM